MCLDGARTNHAKVSHAKLLADKFAATGSPARGRKINEWMRTWHRIGAKPKYLVIIQTNALAVGQRQYIGKIAHACNPNRTKMSVRFY